MPLCVVNGVEAEAGGGGTHVTRRLLSSRPGGTPSKSSWFRRKGSNWPAGSGATELWQDGIVHVDQKYPLQEDCY